MGDEVEVDEDEFPGAVLADVGDDFGDGFVEGFLAPRDGHDAELATVDAPAGGFEDVAGEEMLARQQVSARKGPAADLEAGCLVVARLESAGGEIAQELRPGVLGVADDDGVGVRGGVIGDERDMRSAEDDGEAAAAEMIGERVGADGGAGDHGEADQVRVEVERDVGDALVDEAHVGGDIGRDEGGERRECQGLVAEGFFPDAAAVAVERAFGGNEDDLQARADGRRRRREAHDGIVDGRRPRSS